MRIHSVKSASCGPRRRRFMSRAAAAAASDPDDCSSGERSKELNASKDTHPTVAASESSAACTGAKSAERYAAGHGIRGRRLAAIEREPARRQGGIEGIQHVRAAQIQIRNADPCAEIGCRPQTIAHPLGDAGEFRVRRGRLHSTRVSPSPASPRDAAWRPHAAAATFSRRGARSGFRSRPDCANQAEVVASSN